MRHAAAVAVALALLVPATPGAQPFQAGYNPNVNYFLPNFAFSPNLRKFVDKLPGLGAANANNLGQYIPVATPDQSTFPGADYYEIGLKTYQQRMHSDLPAAGTMLRGYYQKNGTDHASQYLGPAIIARRDRPVRVKFFNELPVGAAGNLPLPVDEMVMGAGMGSLTATGAACDPMMQMCAKYTQNRAAVHLHGGLTPWISDGTPHQWITPAGENTPYKKGVSFMNVPDMIGAGKPVPNPTAGDGVGTLFYSNQQSARLMFYHDHAYGITRLNVYAGEAAPYLITDATEDALIDGDTTAGTATASRSSSRTRRTPTTASRRRVSIRRSPPPRRSQSIHSGGGARPTGPGSPSKATSGSRTSTCRTRTSQTRWTASAPTRGVAGTTARG
jgi:hypothetical protein